MGRLGPRSPAAPRPPTASSSSKATIAFRDAAGDRPYLDDLGVSHVYASPCLKTRSGSPHGYAIVDYAATESRVGRRRRLSGDGRGPARPRPGPDPRHRAQPHGRHPGRKCCGGPTCWRTAPARPTPPFSTSIGSPSRKNCKIGSCCRCSASQYGQVLESGELQLEYREGRFFLRYFQSLLPLDPRTYRPS